MEQCNFSTTKKKYTHLKEKDRYKLEALLDQKHSVEEIARHLEKHVSTLYREIQRGSIDWLQHDLRRKRCYRADVGQRKYVEKAQNKARSLKIGNDQSLAAYIKKKLLKERYSPDAIIGEIKKNGLRFDRLICTKTLYNYIDAGIFAGVSNENLWEKRKRKKRRNKRLRRISWQNRRGRSIEERPEHINRREEYGHWEGDCIKGPAGTRASLLTFTERKTLEQLIIKLKDGTQESVKCALNGLERKYGELFNLKFKTITFDNGSEFLSWKDLELSVLDPQKRRTTTYYAHAYSSWERGSNENQNRMIRRFIPKGTTLKNIRQSDLNQIQKWLNNYPRKRLGYMSAKEAALADMQNSGEYDNLLDSFAL